MLKSHSSLFTPLNINKTYLPNRFMRSATYEALSDSHTGLPTNKLKKMITTLADGEVGLIVPGYVYPIFHGKAAKSQSSMSHYCHAKAWEPVVSSIHQKGSKIMFQVCQGGVMCNPDDIFGHEPIGCSPIDNHKGREMTNEEIEETIESFIQCAKRLKSIGSDGIQLHCAHNYLFCNFLSPARNKRTDKWGGSFDNRLRIVYETAKSIRKVVGDDFLVSIKINSRDYIQNGVTPELCAAYIRRLHPIVDMFELSGGMVGGTIIRSTVNEDLVKKKFKKNDVENFLKFARDYCGDVKWTEGYHAENARIIRRLVPKEVKLALVGGNRKFSAMQKLIDDGTVDMISLCRPFLREPYLVRDLRTGKIDEIGCNSCGLCTMNRKNGIKCQNY